MALAPYTSRQVLLVRHAKFHHITSLAICKMNPKNCKKNGQ